MIIYQSESGNGIIPQAREDFLQHFIVKRQEGDLAVPLAKCLWLQEACWGTDHFDVSALLFQVSMQRWAALHSSHSSKPEGNLELTRKWLKGIASLLASMKWVWHSLFGSLTTTICFLVQFVESLHFKSLMLCHTSTNFISYVGTILFLTYAAFCYRKVDYVPLIFLQIYEKMIYADLCTNYNE